MITLEKVEMKESKAKWFLNGKKRVIRMNFEVKFWVYLKKLLNLYLRLTTLFGMGSIMRTK